MYGCIYIYIYVYTCVYIDIDISSILPCPYITPRPTRLPLHGIAGTPPTQWATRTCGCRRSKTRRGPICIHIDTDIGIDIDVHIAVDICMNMYVCL